MQRELRQKLTRPKGLRITDEMLMDIAGYQAGRRLPDFSDAARELLALGIEGSRGDMAEILDAARVVRQVGLNPVEVLRQAFERTVPCTFVEVAQ